jgi:peptidoglycan hydrolase-like protein with peptidoglycan-binding domain
MDFMNKWKMISASVITASVLMLGVPAGAGAEESTNLSIFDLSQSGVLKVGSKGENVRIMQRALNEAMGAELSEDGIFGPNTKTAVLAFQKSKKLVVDGVYGPNTHAALSKEANSFGFEDSTLKVGSRGEAVKTLQKALNDMSYIVSVDGVFGPQTKTSVIKFQERFPELANDGIFGPKTKAVMDKVLND